MFSGSTRFTVHPRTCGEHRKDKEGNRRVTGSSPHVRGTYKKVPYEKRYPRFIPARAGNIRRRRMIQCVSTVHPRTCGEHFSIAGNVIFCNGSSPHVRGTWRCVMDYVSFCRFIPARAGNIPLRRRPENKRSVHPRTCGEHCDEVLPGDTVNGSSPHVRGTYSPTKKTLPQTRFIPARAGNMFYDRTVAQTRAVHPRTCGEHTGTGAVPSSTAGSSPHVRGTCFTIEPSRRRARFIPARAGNIREREPFPLRPPVHPRTCGEHARNLSVGGTVDGSSPHVRGTFHNMLQNQINRRFIPARAGNITHRSAPTPGRPVHPRTCGEHPT